MKSFLFKVLRILLGVIFFPVFSVPAVFILTHVTNYWLQGLVYLMQIIKGAV